ncbi:MAG TPA: hypothetical protein VMR17_01975 [Xanthobacteraceae bacterium]|nr:hypothetical protein [Xanthobacteraceae bacterium]
MTDYQPLIARAVDGLGKSSGEARRALYERARSALVTQLRSVEPALSESDITRERLSLEEAIRKVEADAARKSRIDVRTESRFEPRPLRAASRPAPAEPPRPPPPERFEPPASELPHGQADAQEDDDALPQAPDSDEPPQAQPAPPRFPASTARSRLLSARSASLTQEGIKGFRGVVNEADDLGTASAKAAQSARETRDTYEPPLRRSPPAADPAGSPPHGRFEPNFDADEAPDGEYDSLQMGSLEPNYDYDDEPPFPSQSARAHPPRPPEAEDDYDEPRPPRSYAGLIGLAIAGCLIGILVALVSWQWSNITHFVAQIGSHQTTQVTPPAPSEPKFSGRVPQDQQTPGQTPGAGPSTDQTAPAVAQRVVLYEEDPNDPQGRRFVGSAIWRTETVSPGPGLAPELAVRADIEIPDRRMTVTWSLRRNTDKALPASHTIEIMFNLPADFPGGGISNVPGVLMKQSEQARGTPLAGLAVKVTNGFFLIGLSAVDAEQQRNIQLLKDQEWFDIPIVYTNGGRAILAVEKGPPGDRAFADAFAAWAK